MPLTVLNNPSKVLPGETRCKCGGQLGYEQSFSRGARTVACSVCHVPVHPDHPMQRRLDAEWAVLEAHQKANPPAPMRPPDYGGIQYGDGNQPLTALQAQVAKLTQMVESLAREVESLKSRERKQR